MSRHQPIGAHMHHGAMRETSIHPLGKLFRCGPVCAQVTRIVVGWDSRRNHAFVKYTICLIIHCHVVSDA
jgi:hypothetical protein